MPMSLTERQPTATPWALLLLILLFGLPPTLAWLYFLNPQWLPDGRSNHGDLIHPARSVVSLRLQDGDGRFLDSQTFSDAWHMAVVTESSCSDPCLEQLKTIHQIRRAIGGNQQRIRAMLIFQGASAKGTVDGAGLGGALAAKALAFTDLVWVPEQSLNEFNDLFELDRRPISDYTFVIDPMGALMMAHDHRQLGHKQVLRDMEKLLKVSQNWVKGAQYGHN